MTVWATIFKLHVLIGPDWYYNAAQVTVPKSCCVLTNNDYENPQPANETACYLESQRISAAAGNNSSQTPTSSDYLHTQVQRILLTSDNHIARINRKYFNFSINGFH